jgi:hypothetical protein
MYNSSSMIDKKNYIVEYKCCNNKLRRQYNTSMFIYKENKSSQIKNAKNLQFQVINYQWQAKFSKYPGIMASPVSGKPNTASSPESLIKGTEM